MRPARRVQIKPGPVVFADHKAKKKRRNSSVPSSSSHARSSKRSKRDHQGDVNGVIKNAVKTELATVPGAKELRQQERKEITDKVAKKTVDLWTSKKRCAYYAPIVRCCSVFLI